MSRPWLLYPWGYFTIACIALAICIWFSEKVLPFLWSGLIKGPKWKYKFLGCIWAVLTLAVGGTAVIFRLWGMWESHGESHAVAGYAGLLDQGSAVRNQALRALVDHAATSTAARTHLREALRDSDKGLGQEVTEALKKVAAEPMLEDLRNIVGDANEPAGKREQALHDLVEWFGLEKERCLEVRRVLRLALLDDNLRLVALKHLDRLDQVARPTAGQHSSPGDQPEKEVACYAELLIASQPMTYKQAALALVDHAATSAPARAALRQALNCPDESVRQAVAEAVRKTAARPMLNDLCAIVKDRGKSTEEIIKAMGDLMELFGREPAFHSQVRTTLRLAMREPALRKVAVEQLEKLDQLARQEQVTGPAQAKPREQPLNFAALLTDVSPVVRKHTMLALVNQASREGKVCAELCQALHHQDEEVRKTLALELTHETANQLVKELQVTVADSSKTLPQRRQALGDLLFLSAQRRDVRAQVREILLAGVRDPDLGGFAREGLERLF